MRQKVTVAVACEGFYGSIAGMTTWGFPGVTQSARAAVLLLGLVFGGLALAQSAGRSGAAIVSEVNGPVKVQIGNGEPRLLRAGQRIPVGATVIVGPGANAVLSFPDGQIVVLGDNTALRIVDYRFDPKDMKLSRVSLNLIEGSARLVMGAIGQYDPSLMRIQVGVGTVAGAPGQGAGNAGAAGVQLEGATTMVAVTQGQVMVRLPDGQGVLLGSGDGAFVERNGAVQQGSMDEISSWMGQTADSKQVIERLENMQSFEFARRNQPTVITLVTPTIPPGYLDLPPLATFTPITTATGAGGGGPPCGASCN